MTSEEHQSATAEPAAAEVFDRAHLYRNTMQNQELAAEVLGLFLVQLPAMLEALESARNPADWAFATHTLKGAAASIGARKLCMVVTALEAMSYPRDINVKLLRVQGVKAAAAEFRQVALTQASTPPGMVVFPALIS